MPPGEGRRAQRDRDRTAGSAGTAGATHETSPESIAESEARHRALMAALPDGVVLQDAEGTVLIANPRASDLLGVGLREGVPVPAPRSASTEQLDAATAAALETGTVQSGITVAVHHEQGGVRSVRLTATPLLGDDGRPQAVVSSISEVTETAVGRPEAAADETFRRVMQFSPIGMAVAGLNGRLLRVNRALCRMFGHRADELQERTLYALLHPADVEETGLRVGELLRGDVDAVALARRFVGQGGMSLQGELSVVLVRDARERPLHLVVQVTDTSDVQRAQAILNHLTLHDPLTGLANRALLTDRIQEALDRGRSGGRRVAVLHCDVDHFSVVNESAGHVAGDAVLVEVGRRIARALRPGDLAGRVGGDAFVIVCADVRDQADAVAVAEHLRERVSLPLAVGRHGLAPSVSIGIALSTSSDADPQDLLRDADIAASRAKDRGRDRWDVADPAMRDRALERLELEDGLRVGIAGGELELHFQPIVGVGDRRVVGREALVRWNHPERGQMPPVRFLPVAEESGLIVDLGAWVLAQAARAAAATPEEAGYVSVNVSPTQVARPGLVDTVGKALADAGLPPGRMVVELTESVMLSAAPGARREIQQLDDLGVRIVVDDFGTGFSALSYLRDLPVSGIKVDRTFTAGLGTDPQCERIVEALTGLGHGLGVDVIVEGVETERQHEMLATIGAGHAQGYLFGRPTPAFTLGA